MSRSTKGLLGLLSFLPILLLIALFVMVFSLIPRFIEWDKFEPEPMEVFSTFGPLFIVGIIMGILSLGLLIFFIMQLLRHKSMDGVEKVVWILVFIFVGVIGYPIYWYMRIWNDERVPL